MPTDLDAGEQLMQEVGEHLPLQDSQLQGPSGQRGEEGVVGGGDHQLRGVCQSLQDQLPTLRGEVSHAASASDTDGVNRKQKKRLVNFEIPHNTHTAFCLK